MMAIEICVKKIVAENLQKLTRHSSLFYIRNRCAYTSKAGGTMDRWRLSRHLWRDIADYNHMSGVMRATLGTPTRNAVHFTYKGAHRTWFNYDGVKNISFMN
jgi:ribosomal protein S14